MLSAPMLVLITRQRIALTFHEAIETAVVPAARRIYEKKRQRLGLDTLRPWDVEVDTSGYQPLAAVSGCKMNLFKVR